MDFGKYYEHALPKITTLFIALVALGVALAALAQYLVSDPFYQTVLVAIGAAVFGAALAFFLVEIFLWDALREVRSERTVRSPGEQPTH